MKKTTRAKPKVKQLWYSVTIPALTDSGKERGIFNLSELAVIRMANAGLRVDSNNRKPANTIKEAEQVLKQRYGSCLVSSHGMSDAQLCDALMLLTAQALEGDCGYSDKQKKAVSLMQDAIDVLFPSQHGGFHAL